jgi:hypothetical protein
MKHDLNAPSFFRKGGLAVLNEQHLTIGKNPDGSFYIDISGKNNARAIVTPLQAFNMAKGIMRVLGYHLEVGPGPQ